MSASSGSIVIIGAGSVGAAIAYSLLLRQLVADIILVDINHEYCQAQVEDLSDATFLSNVRIRQGTAEDARNADIVIISAGAKQKPGETRIGLIDRNIKVLESVTKSLQPIRREVRPVWPHFGRDFQTSQLALNCARLRLTQWGESVKIYDDPKLGRQDATAIEIQLAKDALLQIIVLFADTETISKKYKLTAKAGEDLSVFDRRYGS